MKGNWGKILSSGLLGIVFCLAVTSQVSSDPGRANNLLDFIAQAYPTPERLAAFLHQNVIFQDDLRLFGQIDYWQAPEEMIARRRGDCEDYALLASDLLNRQGRKAFLFSLYGDHGYAHTVCVFVEDGRYSVLNQDRLVRYRASSLEELAGRLCAGWRWGAVAQRQGHRGRAVRLIRREGLGS